MDVERVDARRHAQRRANEDAARCLDEQGFADDLAAGVAKDRARPFRARAGVRQRDEQDDGGQQRRGEKRTGSHAPEPFNGCSGRARP